MNSNRRHCENCGANNDGSRPLAHLRRECDPGREPEWRRRAREAQAKRGFVAVKEVG